jgi:hypothetical protein
VSGLQFFQLPVIQDQGLPQAFSCDVGPRSYDFAVYANLDVPASDPPETVYDLSSAPAAVKPASPPGFLVLRVVAAGPAGPHVIFLRKLVPEPLLVHYAGDLAIKLLKASVARGNLNGSGHYGTQIVIGAAQRWA